MKTNVVRPFYSVEYVDDNKRKHITVARNQAELAFIRDRFEQVSFEVVVPTDTGMTT